MKRFMAVLLAVLFLGATSLVWAEEEALAAGNDSVAPAENADAPAKIEKNMKKAAKGKKGAKAKNNKKGQKGKKGKKGEKGKKGKNAKKVKKVEAADKSMEPAADAAVTPEAEM